MGCPLIIKAKQYYQKEDDYPTQYHPDEYIAGCMPSGIEKKIRYQTEVLGNLLKFIHRHVKPITPELLDELVPRSSGDEMGRVVGIAEEMEWN